MTALRKRGWLDGRVGVELGESFVSPGTMDRFRQLLGQTVDGTGLVEAGRAIKSAEEITLIRQACRITEAGAVAALDAIRPGVTENAVSSAAYAAMMAAGVRFLRRRPDRDVGVAVGRRAPHVREPPPRAGRHDPARAERVSPAVLRPADARRRDRSGARRGAPDVGRHHRSAERGHRGDSPRRDERRSGRGVPGAHRARRLGAELPQAHGLLGRRRLRAQLGRGPHREPPPGRPDALEPGMVSTCRPPCVCRGNRASATARRCW